jgi:hypothetical protein
MMPISLLWVVLPRTAVITTSIFLQTLTANNEPKQMQMYHLQCGDNVYLYRALEEETDAKAQEFLCSLVDGQGDGTAHRIVADKTKIKKGGQER